MPRSPMPTSIPKTYRRFAVVKSICVQNKEKKMWFRGTVLSPCANKERAYLVETEGKSFASTSSCAKYHTQARHEAMYTPPYSNPTSHGGSMADTKCREGCTHTCQGGCTADELWTHHTPLWQSSVQACTTSRRNMNIYPSS